MSEYNYPHRDAMFVLQQLVDFDQLCKEMGLDEVNSELISEVLQEAGRFGKEVLAPLNVPGDKAGSTWSETGVKEPAGFAEAYQAFIDAGWPTLVFPENLGGQALPNIVGTAANEIWQSANLAFSLCPLLSQGASEAIIRHGDEALCSTWLPKLVSGEWAGSMNLTEPQAGSDLAAVKTRAVPEGDHYLLSGQKIFITWGDHQMASNIVHLVLARLPDAPPGVKGISLFVVPKFLLDENGEPGEQNDVHCVSIEHKLGIHASPTCTMSFGDQGGAVGYMVGEPNKGLMYMFTMMNVARQSTGQQGISLAERSYQQALEYARERVQGSQPDGSPVVIIDHPDVRRMLMHMRSSIEAMRGLSLLASAEIDRQSVAQGEEAQKRQERVELYTPIVKGWITEMGQELTYLGIQIYGGMGFVEETGIAQHYRDARIITIYEGTTGIQALDFVGRKILRNNGVAINALLEEIGEVAESLAGQPETSQLAESLGNALKDARQATDWVLKQGSEDQTAVNAVSVPYLMLAGYLCGGWIMCRLAQRAIQMMGEGDSNQDFLNAKVATARFYCEHLLPRTLSLTKTVVSGSESVMALDTAQL